MPEIIHNMPEAEYHARPEVSKHDMDLIRRAPLLYRYRKDNPEPPDEEMNFGSLVHLALLQPHLLEQSVAFIPANAPDRPLPVQIQARIDGKKMTESAAERFGFWDKWDEENKGKQIVTPASYEKVLGIQKSIMSNPDTAIYFDESPREVSLFWDRKVKWKDSNGSHEAMVPCRARLDIMGRATIPDLKTCCDASRGGFMKDIGKRRYSHQGEHYMDGAAACGNPVQAFTMIAVETHPPFLCAAHVLGPTSLEIARQENLRDLTTYQKCVESGTWPNIRNHFQPLEAPVWGFDD